MMSSRSSICSDWYGCVWKKSNPTAAVTEVSTPASRPPKMAATTTTMARISATLVGPRKSRAGTSTADTTIAATAPRPATSRDDSSFIRETVPRHESRQKGA